MSNSASSSSPRTEWYAEGLHFGCTQCGNCCTGPTGAVWFNEREARAMAGHFGLSVAEFRVRYARKLDWGDPPGEPVPPSPSPPAPLSEGVGSSATDAESSGGETSATSGGWSLNERETEHGFDCIFLDRTSMPGKAVCSIYEVRPTQCRTWPFWPENLTTRRRWETVKRRTPCPGMDAPPQRGGRLVPIEEIRIHRDTPMA